jgi:hypothetical protein
MAAAPDLPGTIRGDHLKPNLSSADMINNSGRCYFRSEGAGCGMRHIHMRPYRRLARFQTINQAIAGSLLHKSDHHRRGKDVKASAPNRFSNILTVYRSDDTRLLTKDNLGFHNAILSSYLISLFFVDTCSSGYNL